MRRQAGEEIGQYWLSVSSQTLSRTSAMKSSLQNFDPKRFMRNHWQQKPYFVKSALAADFLSLHPADLFHLAGRPEVESRLVTRKKVRGHWRYGASDGPFEKDQLAAYKDRSDWTLLVQRVNEWLPRVDLLFEYFSFVANWRTDDIMISYAAPGGTVGPHLDNYDVFLCQLYGKRTWQYGSHAHKTELLEKNQGVRILTDFKADNEVVTHPGDMLYIPPQFAHYGVADSESITVSVGFRAPQLARLMGVFADQVISHGGGSFYGDRGAAIPKNPGEFSESALKKLFAQAQTGLIAGSRSLKAETLGDTLLRDLSATPNSQIRSRASLTLSQFKARWLKQNLQRNPRNQYFFRANRGAITLYAAGESFVMPANLRSEIIHFCNGRVFISSAARLKSHPLAFWYEMFSLGFVFFQK